MSSRLASVTPLLVVLAVVVVSGCGDSGGGTSQGTATGAARVRVGLVTDIGGLNDRSFNFLANQGLRRAARDLGIESRVLISRNAADYVPNLGRLAREGYDLVIAVGFLMSDALSSVAARFPGTRFAIIDVSQADLDGDPPNVRGLLFREEQAGYLAGLLAALQLKDEGKPLVLAAVGGRKIPPVDHYIAGYRAGARSVSPDARVRYRYSQDFVDPARCKEIALAQIAAGAQVVFQVAGGCGLGALSAAQDEGVWGIGVDADQSYLGPHILTSAVKKVDVAVHDTIAQVVDGTFAGGADTVQSVAGGGVGIGAISPRASRATRASVAEAEDRLARDTIDVPDAP